MMGKSLVAGAAAVLLPGSVIAGIAAAGVAWGGSVQDSFALEALPAETAHNYHFVEAHPDSARYIPCYCGCSGLGHTSLLDCYISPKGGYERHASGCGICGMETDDIERLVAAGDESSAIRDFIDASYSSYGKPTNTPKGPTP